MEYFPNHDGTLYFLTNIFPKLKGEFPDLTIHIIGKNPANSIRRFNGGDIKVHGFIEDPYPIIKKSSLVIVPIRAGAGISNKILEAMAMKKASVVSRVAARGIQGANHKEHFMVSGTKKEWIDNISTLLRDPERRREIGRKGYDLVRDKYRWSQVQSEVLNEIDEILSSRT